MLRLHPIVSTCLRRTTSTLILLGGTALGDVARPLLAQDASAMATAEPAKEEEIPHPFFTHMGLPEGVGNFNLRLLGLAARADGQSTGDFALHLETGITKNIGLHIRNDRARTNDKTEAMFQYTALISNDGMSGFAPIIEFEVPTRSGASRINTLVGYTASLGAPRWAFNHVLHYDPREDMIDASAAIVVGASRTVFPVLELLGEGGKDRAAAVVVLAGFKVRLQDWLIGGVAIQLPITRSKEFNSQLAFGPDFEWTTRR